MMRAPRIALLLVLCLIPGLDALCYGGWGQWQYSCYLLNTGPITHTWNDARQRCMEQDGDLVVIDSTQEREWLISQTNRYLRGRPPIHDWWTGLNALPDGTTWQWPNNSAATIAVLNNRWRSGQPNKTRNNMCVEIKDNRFTVQSCFLKLHAICERSLTKALTCDSGWTLDSGMCYKFFGDQDYNGAWQQCQNEGATLPQVYDQITEKAVWSQAMNHRRTLWIGLRSQQSGSGYQWLWENGTALRTGYWTSNPPSSLGGMVNSTCVQQTLGNVTSFSWKPVPCSARSSFLCQKPQGTCPSGWLQFTNRCFNIFTRTPKTFSDAQGYCQGLGGNLISLDSGDLNLFLQPYIKNARGAGAYTLWIGLTDQNSDRGPWRWVADNKTISWSNWPGPASYFNTPGKRDCGTIDSSDQAFKWRPVGNCDLLNTFICQLPVNKPLQHPTQPPKHYSCPSGYKLYQPLGTCTRLYPQDMTWLQARTYCQSHGADLLTIPDGRFNNFLRSQIQLHIGKYWIGLHDRSAESHFQWLDSTTKPRFLNWHSGQPSNSGGNANCVAIFPQDNFKWWTSSCTAKFNFFCQKDAVLNGQTQAPTTQPTWSPRCGRLWEEDPNSNSCYMFVTDRLSWLDAIDACHSRQGDLVSINSVTEQYYINGRISGLGSNFLWVGANDRQTESGWRWSDNSPMAYINWKPNEPDNRGNSDCVAISGVDGRWSDFLCSARYGYICEKPAIGVTTRLPTSPTPPRQIPSGMVWGCQRGWRGFSGQCYSFQQSKAVTWTAASTRCGQLGSALVSIHSAAENNFVYTLMPRGYRNGAWLGLNDRKKEGSFEWSDASAVTFTLWKPHEPDNLKDADCVSMYNSKSWADYQCGTNVVHAFICKKPMALQSNADMELSQGCSQGLGFRAQCYVYVNSPSRPWQSAQQDCRRRHGNLATVNDKYIQAFVSAELTGRTSLYWIGLKNVGPQNNTYMWSSNYAVDFTYWSMNHTGNEMGTCVAMTAGRQAGLWQNAACARSLPYICEMPRRGFTTPPPTSPTTVGRVSCPDGWTTLDILCIKAFNVSQGQQLSWMESQSACRGLGGDLLDVRSKDMEDAIISQVFNNVTEGNWWIGLNDRASEQGHEWSDGKGVVYTNWWPGEPNDYNNREDCVLWHFQPANGTHGWQDANCYIARRYICYIKRRKHPHLTTTAMPPTGVTSRLCPTNGTWLYLSGHCYYMSPASGPAAKLNWYEARRTCQSMHADLVSVHSVDENGFLTTAMSKHYQNRFWLGLNDLGGSGYSWTDGSPMNYVSWNVNQPNDAYGGERCVESNSVGVWDDKNCMDRNAYICKELPRGMTPSSPTLPPVVGGCPHGYSSAPFLEKCYRLGGLADGTSLNFTAATQFCRQQSPPASLVSIHYSLEQRYLTTLIVRLPRKVWIGLNDLKHRNYFEWQDNSEMDFTYWGPGEPDENLKSDDPADRRDCVAMNTDALSAGTWNDMNCGAANHFICQVNRVPSIPTLQPENTGCRAGYTKLMKRCYKYFGTPKSWTQAQATCARDGGVLATLLNRFQTDAVGLLRVPDRNHAQNISDIWIGLRLIGSNTFQWVNNWPVRYTSWAFEEPDNTGQCVKMDTHFFWHDHPCDTAYPFVCQLGDAPVPTVTTVKGVCEVGWSPHGEYCYRLMSSDLKSWPGARYACQQQGASLLSVHSMAEMSFVNSLVVTAASKGVSPEGGVWLGLSKAADNGFAWSDNTEMEFDYWDQGEPSDSDRGQHQDCVQLSVSTGKWNDVDCFSNNYYMCKMLQEVNSATANPQKQTGSAADLSGGAVAGIAIAAAVIIAIAIVAGILLRGRLPVRSRPGPPTENAGAGSFDNALYIKEGKQGRAEEGSVSFGADNDNQTES